MIALLRLVLIIFFALCPLGAAQVSVKAVGGGGFYFGGDYNSGLEGLNSRVNDVFDNVSGSYLPLDRGWEGEAAVMLDLGRVFSVGLAVGIRSIRTESEVSYDWRLLDLTFDARENTRMRLSSVPVAVLLGARFPLGRRVRIALEAGAERAWNRLEYDAAYESRAFLSSRENYSFRGRRASYGLRGGAGLEVELSPRLSLIIELCGRSSRLEEISGRYERSGEVFGLPFHESGEGHSLWQYQERHSGKTYDLVGFGQAAPLTAVTGSGRPASISLSGVAARAGLKASF